MNKMLAVEGEEGGEANFDVICQSVFEVMGIVGSSVREMDAI
jgi:hypothetical protein